MRTRPHSTRAMQLIPSVPNNGLPLRHRGRHRARLYGPIVATVTIGFTLSPLPLAISTDRIFFDSGVDFLDMETLGSPPLFGCGIP